MHAEILTRFNTVAGCTCTMFGFKKDFLLAISFVHSKNVYYVQKYMYMYLDHFPWPFPLWFTWWFLNLVGREISIWSVVAERSSALDLMFTVKMRDFPCVVFNGEVQQWLLHVTDHKVTKLLSENLDVKFVKWRPLQYRSCWKQILSAVLSA